MRQITLSPVTLLTTCDHVVRCVAFSGVNAVDAVVNVAGHSHPSLFSALNSRRRLGTVIADVIKQSFSCFCCNLKRKVPEFSALLVRAIHSVKGYLRRRAAFSRIHRAAVRRSLFSVETTAAINQPTLHLIRVAHCFRLTARTAAQCSPASGGQPIVTDHRKATVYSADRILIFNSGTEASNSFITTLFHRVGTVFWFHRCSLSCVESHVN